MKASLNIVSGLQKRSSMDARTPSARRRTWLICLGAWAALHAMGAWMAPSTAWAQEGNNAFGGAGALVPGTSDEPLEPFVFLSSDRGRERVLDRAKRLAADGRWSDAAAGCDEILGGDQDAFADADGKNGSLRGQAAAIVAGFPRPGREAYLLLFRAQAEKRLSEAIAANDGAAVVAVARRWFDTPAGRHAAMITAMRALEEGEPLVAATWLDRVAGSGDATEFEPTLSVMRAIACRLSGEAKKAAGLLARAASRGRTTRLGGQDLVLSGMETDGGKRLEALTRSLDHNATPGRSDWLQARGSPSRNTIVEASKPLLVPRYRIPLVRHPDEARALEKRRRTAADAGGPLIPAGTPLAVGNFLLVHTPLGILAIDFETGKRLWLESSVAPTEPDDRAEALADTAARLFDDATSGNLASDGRSVFAVEVPPEALASFEATAGGLGFGRGLARPPSSWNGGNVLRAYDIAHGGSLRWGLPDTERAASGDPTDSPVWFCGAPLVAGPELYVLAEEGGEVRLECRGTDDGHLRWQQPLATYDDRETITNPEARSRRLAGLTPSLADGVLVCPVGAGCVVAIDTATRTLLWAHTYARSTPDDEGQRRGSLAPSGESSPVIAAGFAVLAPYDATGLVCVRLRDGTPAWPHAKRGRYRIAGVVGHHLIVTTDTTVEAIELETGNRIWKLPLADIGRPSGRGILTPHSLLVPLDTPEVVEIGLADGRIKGRSPARGGSVPGNLVAHRGEIIARGVDAIEVFHQEAALDARIETAMAREPSNPWAAHWGGQLAIEAGNVEQGLDLIARAIASPSLRLPPGAFSATLVRALDRDFAVAAAWQADHADARSDDAVLRTLVDGFLGACDAERAWASLRRLLMNESPNGEVVFRDAADPWLVITKDRWIRGRLQRLVSLADQSLTAQIDAECRGAIDTALARADTSDRQVWLEALTDRLGAHPASERLWRFFMAHGDAPTSRQRAVRGSLAALDTGGVGQEKGARVDAADAWPLGAVTRTMHAVSKRPADHGRMHPIPIPLNGAGLQGTRAMQATLDGGQRRLILSDGLGNSVGEPIPLDAVSEDLMPWVNRTNAIEVAVIGRALFVRTRKELAAYDLDAEPGRGRGLWRRPDLAATTDPTSDGRWGVGGRVARDGWVPLGMRISEPDESPRGDGRGMIALPGFVVVPGPRSVTLLDPASGRLLWERRRLPPGLEWTVDANAICGLTTDGFRCLVLDTTDGRVLHQVDMPHRRQRLATHGRCVVAIRSIDELPGRFTARRVRLELIDPATRQTRSLGAFSGDARATEAGPGRLAVLEPGGTLTFLDVETATTVFQSALPDPPRHFARLIVQPWQDRYLVLAGSPVEGEEAAGVSPLQQLMLSSPASAPMSGRLWAIDRMSGESLWQAPALIERHCLHTAQPPELPVLTFCRLMHGAGERDQTRLSLLMLDKRTGHAVVDDDRIAIPSHAFLGCEIVGSAENHAVTLAEPAGGAVRLSITFTGDPIPPQPPYRGSGRLPFSSHIDRFKSIGRIFEQAVPDTERADDPAAILVAPEDFE